MIIIINDLTYKIKFDVLTIFIYVTKTSNLVDSLKQGYHNLYK